VASKIKLFRHEIFYFAYINTGIIFIVRIKFIVCNIARIVLSKGDVIRLQEAAELYNERPSQYHDAKCTYFYRNKPEEYFDAIFSTTDGIMETYLKDASGDLRSPINGEICGLFFFSNVNRSRRR